MNSNNRAEYSVNAVGACGQLEGVFTEAVPTGVPITAVVCHPHSLMGGTMNNKVVHTVSRAFREIGVQSIRFNFRGVGQSEGQYDAGIGETDDVFAVLAWVKQHYPTHKIWLAGFSFGSFVAARAATLASEYAVEIEQLLLIAPPVMKDYQFTNLAPFTCPVVVLMGEADEVVPPDAVYQWFETLPQPAELVRFAETSHFFHGKLTDLKNHIKEIYVARR